jgi:surfeit locus 1 family protein
LAGTFDFDNEVVLTNRSRDGAPGVNILTPVRVPGRDTAVLVNRGWVYAPDGATVDLARWREPTKAGGTAYVSWMSALSTASDARPAPPPAHNTVRRAARLDRDVIAAMIPYPIAPYQLVLLDADAIDEGGAAYGGAGAGPFGTAAPPDPTRPIRIPLPALDEGAHKSYAIQWFSFAAIALLGTAAVVRGEGQKRDRDSAL